MVFVFEAGELVEFKSGAGKDLAQFVRIGFRVHEMPLDFDAVVAFRSRNLLLLRLVRAL